MAGDNKSKQKAKSNQLLKRALNANGIADRMIAQIDPTYNDRKVLSEQDAKLQEVINRQLDVIQGVSNTQVVDIIASIRNNQTRRNKGNKRRSSNPALDSTEVFTENIGDIYGFFQDYYKNRYIEVDDLKLMARFIPSIGEGIRLYIDAITASDDVKETITRNIILPGDDSDTDNKEIIAEIKRLEKEHNLHKRLKIAWKKMLISSTFYVYHIAYKDLFKMYADKVKQDGGRPQGPQFMNSNSNISDQVTKPSHDTAPFGMAGYKPATGKNKRNPLNIANESQTEVEVAPGEAMEGVSIPVNTYEPALESFGAEITHTLVDAGMVRKCNYGIKMDRALESIGQMVENSYNASHVAQDSMQVIGAMVSKKDGSGIGKAVEQSLRADLPNIYFVESPIPIDIMNDVSGVAMEAQSSDFAKFFNESKAVEDLYKQQKKDNPGFKEVGNGPDGTYDANYKPMGSFEGISGTYLKWLDYKQALPIEVLGRVVGYYHIITTTHKRTKKLPNSNVGDVSSVLSTGSMSLFNQGNVAQRRKDEAVQHIVDTISEAILDQFGSRFVKKNPSFRKIIAECIIANGLVDNDYMIQFIPAENIVEFKCNEDDEGKGTSILSEAMFPAHQLLSIVACKMLNYINKGGNKTIAHISSGRTNRNSTNQVNRVIRDMQSANVTFTDLLSSGAVFSKVTRDSNMAMPKDAQGNRLVEFEVQEGQMIELDTEYERMLERWVLIGMGVPPSFMDYVGNTDLAKKIVSDHVTFASRVASIQADIEDPTTELYRALIKDSDMDDTLKARASVMQYQLPRPSILKEQNDIEAINNALSKAQVVANMYVGEDANEPEDLQLKNIFIKKQVRKAVPYIDWDEMDELFEQSKTELRKEQLAKAKTQEQNGNTTGLNPNEMETPGEEPMGEEGGEGGEPAPEDEGLNAIDNAIDQQEGGGGETGGEDESGGPKMSNWGFEE